MLIIRLNVYRVGWMLFWEVFSLRPLCVSVDLTHSLSQPGSRKRAERTAADSNKEVNASRVRFKVFTLRCKLKVDLQADRQMIEKPQHFWENELHCLCKEAPDRRKSGRRETHSHSPVSIIQYNTYPVLLKSECERSLQCLCVCERKHNLLNESETIFLLSFPSFHYISFLAFVSLVRKVHKQTSVKRAKRESKTKNKNIAIFFFFSYLPHLDHEKNLPSY